MPFALTLYSDDLIKVLLALLIGMVVGIERELRDKPAGLRTITLICLGSTLFTIFSARLAGDKDPTRIASNIVTGVGFLGAGVILHQGGAVRGLTTAATVWLSAALGMVIGAGYLLFAAVVTFASVLVLIGFPRVEAWLNRFRDTAHVYKVTIKAHPEKYAQLEEKLRQCELDLARRGLDKHGNLIVVTWVAWGSPNAHRAAAQMLAADADVKSLRLQMPV